MPWVRLDDRFPSHRKVALLSDRAFRLYVSALCWSSENLTEGKILDRELAVVARLRGAKAAAKELEAAGLWDRLGDGWEIHDFLEYQRDREQVRADRAANAARQKAWRERKKAEKEAERNAHRNGVTDTAAEPENDATTTATRHDDDTNARETDAAKHSSPQANAVRNGVSNGTPSSSPSPSHSGTSYGGTSSPPAPLIEQPGTDVAERPGGGGGGEIRPLIEAMGARSMNVTWNLANHEWFQLRDDIRRVGIPALVDYAARAWQSARNTPHSARYFLQGWAGLQDAPAFTGPRPLGPPSKASTYLANMAALADELRAAEGGNP